MSRIMECCPDCGMPYGVAPCDCDGTPDEMINIKLRAENTELQSKLVAKDAEIEKLRAERDALKARIDGAAKAFLMYDKNGQLEDLLFDDHWHKDLIRDGYTVEHVLILWEESEG